MAQLTRDFKETVKELVKQDPEFKEALFNEAISLFLEDDIEAGKAVLRDYIDATIGFEELGSELGRSSKSLIGMLSARGNPRAYTLFPVLRGLQETTGVHLAIGGEKKRARMP